MSDVVIRAEELSKRYTIGSGQRYRTLREALSDAARIHFRALGSGNGRRNLMQEAADRNRGRFFIPAASPPCHYHYHYHYHLLR